MFKAFFAGSAKGAAKGAGKVANLYKPSTIKAHGWVWRISLAVGTLAFIIAALMLLWSSQPSTITAQEAVAKYIPQEQSKTKNKNIKTGAALTAITVHLIDTLVHKNGGYLSNDIIPPGKLMDNMPSWEYGILRNLRDTSKVFRAHFSTSGSQSKMDKDLIEMENKLSIDSEQWMFPRAEESYDDAGQALKRYLLRITDDNDADAQFNARADNLRHFLNTVSQNLGSYSQRLSESVGVKSENFSLAGDSAAKQTTKAPKQLFNKTVWYKVDNNFYEARGYTWALLHQMRAIEIDFASVLAKKNATPYVKQLIRELEATQQTVWSPIILNGNGFGVVTNHSLVMASYLTRANAIIIELSNLLENG